MGRTLISLYRERRAMKNIALLSLLTLAILQPLAEAQKEKGTTISVSNHLNTGTRLSMNCNLTLDQSSCSTTTREFPNIPNGETSQITDKNPNCAVTGINCIAIGKGQEACTRFYPGFNMFDVKTANRGKGCYYKDANHDLEDPDAKQPGDREPPLNPNKTDCNILEEGRFALLECKND